MNQENVVKNSDSGKAVTFKAEEIFYYLFFAIMLFAKGIGLYEGMKAFTLCIIAAFICFTVKVCLTEHTVGELVLMFVLMVFGLLAYRNSGEMAAFIYVLVVVGMKHIPVKRVFKVGAAVWTAAFFSTTILALLKQIPDLALVHSKLGLGHIIRWSLGYPHPNVLHISYVILLSFFFYLAKLNRKQLIAATILLYAGNFYIFLYSVSYTGLIFTTVYLLANLYFNFRGKFSKFEEILIQCIYPVCALLSVLGPVFIKGKLFDILNKMMNTRWNLSRYFLTEQRISFFGTRMVNLPDGNYNIDCSYVYILMYYGIILFVLISVAYFFTIRGEVMRGKNKELAIMAAFLIAGMSEPFMANLSFKNLTLIFIGEYYYSVSVKAADKKKELLWNCLIRLLPWAEKTVTVSLPDRIHPIGRLKEIYRQQGKKIVLVSLAAALVSGGGYFAFAERAESAYIEVGLSDYWPGDKVRLDRNELPEKFNSLIIGNADGKTDMYLLTGNIVALEHFRDSVSIGLAGGLAALFVYSVVLSLKHSSRRRKKVI